MSSGSRLAVLLAIVCLSSVQKVCWSAPASRETASAEEGWTQIIDQTVEVNGTVRCEANAAVGAEVKLYDVNGGQQTLLVSAVVGESGDFTVEGMTHWEGPGHKEGDNRIEPQLVIRHNCGGVAQERVLSAEQLKPTTAVSGSWPDAGTRVDRIQGSGNFEAGLIQLAN